METPIFDGKNHGFRMFFNQSNDLPSGKRLQNYEKSLLK